MTLAERVRAERAALGLSQAELASRAGISRRTVTDLEDDGDNPRLATIAALARALGLRVEDLFLAGPELLDLSFGLGPSGVSLGPLATLEHRVRSALSAAAPGVDFGRVAVWPWSEEVDPRFAVLTTPSSTVTLRAPASLVVAIAELAGRPLPLAPRLVLSAPVVRPVVAAENLRVLVRGPSAIHVATEVRRETTAAGCCPAVKVETKRPLGDRSAWVANVLGVPAAASAILQRLRVAGPDGLFVPA